MKLKKNIIKKKKRIFNEIIQECELEIYLKSNKIKI